MNTSIKNQHQDAPTAGSTLAVLALIVLAALVALLLPSMSLAQTPTSGTSSRPLAMRVYEGFTEPRHDIMVAATEIGRLDAVDVQLGDRVKAGQVIGSLEDDLQASSVKIATLQAEMTGELEAAAAEADLHRSRTASLRKLAAEGMARPDELARAETDLRISTSRLLAAQEQLALRKLELERYRLQLERRKIRVPMDGVISKIFHKPGEYITPGDPAVARLLVMDKLYAVFNVPVEDTGVVKVGVAVRIYLRSSSQTLEAVITSVAPDIDGESGTVQVRVELDNADRELLVGDRCTLRLAPAKSATSAKLPANDTSIGRVRSR